METKMNILFIGKKSRISTQKLLPIYLRVTIEGKRFEVATNRQVAGLWLPGTDNHRENRYFSVDSLREKWFGEDRRKLTLLGIFRLSIMDLEKLVTKGQYCKSTLVKYKTTEKHLIDFCNGEIMEKIFCSWISDWNLLKTLNFIYKLKKTSQLILPARWLKT